MAGFKRDLFLPADFMDIISEYIVCNNEELWNNRIKQGQPYHLIFNHECGAPFI